MLLGAVSLVLAVLGFVDLVFSPDGVQTFRWLLLVLVAVLAAATVASRDHHPARAVAFADAGGLAALGLALTLVVDQVFGSAPLFGPGAGTGWEPSSTPAASGCARSRRWTVRRARGGSA